MLQSMQDGNHFVALDLVQREVSVNLFRRLQKPSVFVYRINQRDGDKSVRIGEASQLSCQSRCSRSDSSSESCSEKSFSKTGLGWGSGGGQHVFPDYRPLVLRPHPLSRRIQRSRCRPARPARCLAPVTHWIPGFLQWFAGGQRCLAAAVLWLAATGV